MVPWLLAVLAIKAAAQCTCADSQAALTNNGLVFVGNFTSATQARVQYVVKGPQTLKTTTFASNCRYNLSRPYVIYGNQNTNGFTLSCALLVSAVPLESLVFLRSQFISGPPAKCVDGSQPTTCNITAVCAPQVSAAACPAARTCSVNPCGGCRAQYTNASSQTVCPTLCPSGIAPLRCRSTSCPANLKAPTNCPGAVCVVDTCNTCAPRWVRPDGSRCLVIPQCTDVNGVLFGTGNALLGFAILRGQCQAVRGTSPSPIALYRNLSACQQECRCQDYSRAVLPTGQVQIFVASQGACRALNTTKAFKSLVPTFATIRDCNAVCFPASTTTTPATTAPVRPATPAPCNPASANCCPNGLLADTCLTEAGQQYCANLKCGSQKPATCTLDKCNKCKPVIKTAAGAVIANNLCTLDLTSTKTCNPQSPATVSCPSSYTCPPRPTDCPSDWSLLCLQDPCSCKGVWFSQDLRKPSDACAKALAPQCVSDCPADFSCGQKPANADTILKNYPSGYQWQCVQAPCTCVPTWVPGPPGGIPIISRKTPCSATDKNCCASGFLPVDCSSVADNTRTTCQQMVCSNANGPITVARCGADPCNDCNVKAKDDKNRDIDPSSCTLGQAETTCPFSPAPTCTSTAKCKALPSACPSDWKIDCVVDPCLCVSNLVDHDARYTPPACSVAIQPDCYTTSTRSCPNYVCNPIPDETKQQVAPSVIRTLVCVQNPCDCRPVWLTPQAAAIPIQAGWKQISGVTP